MTDIVKKLLEVPAWMMNVEAAEEITRLRADRDALMVAVKGCIEYERDSIEWREAWAKLLAVHDIVKSR